MNRPAAESKYAAEDVPGTSDGYYAMANQGNANKNETTDKTAWAEMGREEAQEQLNDADKSEISAIDILLHYWKYASGNLMVKVTGLHGLGDETVESDDAKIN